MKSGTKTFGGFKKTIGADFFRVTDTSLVLLQQIHIIKSSLYNFSLEIRSTNRFHNQV
jgi:hypothetical protein